MSNQTTLQQQQSQIKDSAQWVAGIKNKENQQQDCLVKDPLQQYFQGNSYEEGVGQIYSKMKGISEALKQYSTTKSFSSGYEYLADSYQKSKELIAQQPSTDMNTPTNTLTGKIKAKEQNERVDRPISLFTARQLFTDNVASILTSTESKYFTLNLLGYSNMRVSQVVIMGAGFDSRSHYLEALKGTDVFELDFPDLLELKKNTLSTLGAEVPGTTKSREEFKFPLMANSLQYVPVDFNDENWTKSLVSSGFKKDEPTLWIAEGLLLFFDKKKAQSLLKETVRLAAQGSYFVVEYPTAEVSTMLAAFYKEVGSWFKDISGGITGDIQKYYENTGWQLVDSLDVYQLCNLFSKQGYNQDILFSPNTWNYAILYKHITGQDNSAFGTV